MNPLGDTDLVDIAVTLAPGDGECIRCGEYFSIHGAFAMWHDGEVCTDCAPPDIAQAVAALDELHEVITIGDVSSRNRRALADTLRNLARLADQITSGERTVHKAIDFAAGPWSNDEPCGVHLDWHIDSAPPRTHSTAPMPPGQA
ncbi:hypothetical protein GCM10023191_092360 [Actinoallomurus oryzae]|uniref:Uncharacterized protein n=1 Tax=Actinoallomurus oryzae TaxID=502180 RepID=A0ABP8R5H4_9ACTN